MAEKSHLVCDPGLKGQTDDGNTQLDENLGRFDSGSSQIQLCGTIVRLRIWNSGRHAMRLAGC